jgi:hypothetical protein
MIATTMIFIRSQHMHRSSSYPPPETIWHLPASLQKAITPIRTTMLAHKHKILHSSDLAGSAEPSRVARPEAPEAVGLARTHWAGWSDSSSAGLLALLGPLPRIRTGILDSPSSVPATLTFNPKASVLVLVIGSRAAGTTCGRYLT